VDILVKNNSLKVVVFKIGNEEYALAVEQVVSIERMQEIRTLPKTPDYYRGITTIRGVVIPVIDLRRVMNSDVSENEYSRLIIVKISGKSMGLVVDAASDVLDIPNDSIQDSNFSTIETDYLLGVFKLNHRLILLIQIEILIGNLENFQKIKDIN